MSTKFLLSAVLLLVFLSVNAQVFNNISQNGYTNDTTGYQFEFEGAAGNNCLQMLGQRWDIQPINWNVSINEDNHSLKISAKQDQPQPRNFWIINNYFSDALCRTYVYTANSSISYNVDLSENLSLSYRVKSNVALSSFNIAAITWYSGGDFFSQGPLGIYPNVSLEANEWKTVDFDLCINSINWQEVVSTLTNQYGGSLIKDGVGFSIRIDDAIVQTNRDIIIEIDYVRIGAAAGDCPTITTGTSTANSNAATAAPFPNPFHDYLQLPVQSDIEYVEILNMNQQVLVKIENNFDEKINTSNLVAGMYLIKYHSLDGSVNMSKAIKN